MNGAEWLRAVAPTVATALGGPLAGLAVEAVGSAFGWTDATKEKVEAALTSGSLTNEQVAQLKLAEMEMVRQERELGFRFAELEFKDRDSARRAAVDGGTSWGLFWLSLVLLVVCLGAEILVLFYGVPPNTSDLVAGRVLGLLDSVALLVLSFNYGSTTTSRRSAELLAKAPPVGH